MKNAWCTLFCAAPGPCELRLASWRNNPAQQIHIASGVNTAQVTNHCIRGNESATFFKQTKKNPNEIYFYIQYLSGLFCLVAGLDHFYTIRRITKNELKWGEAWFPLFATRAKGRYVCQNCPGKRHGKIHGFKVQMPNAPIPPQYFLCDQLCIW